MTKQIKKERKKAETKKHSILKNVFWILVFLCLLLVTLLIFLHAYSRHSQDYLLPDFSGQTIEEAAVTARPLELRLEVVDSLYMPNLPKGTIFRQVPPAGQHVKKNRRVELTVNSSQPRQVEMPNLVGYSLRQAKAVLASHSLVLGKLIYTPDMATNNVLDQRCKGRSIAPGTIIDILTPIDLELGLSPDNELASIPDLKGQNLDAARDILSDHSLNIGRIQYDGSVHNATDSLAARVFRQSPVPSPESGWPLGTTVHLTLTVNADLLKVEPPMTGNTASEETNTPSF